MEKSSLEKGIEWFKDKLRERINLTWSYVERRNKEAIKIALQDFANRIENRINKHIYEHDNGECTYDELVELIKFVKQLKKQEGIE